MAKHKFTIELPYATQFNDYHDIADALDIIQDFAQDFKLKAKEVASDGSYWAIVYKGKFPPEKIIRLALKKAGFRGDEIYR